METEIYNQVNELDKLLIKSFENGSIKEISKFLKTFGYEKGQNINDVKVFIIDNIQKKELIYYINFIVNL